MIVNNPRRPWNAPAPGMGAAFGSDEWLAEQQAMLNAGTTPAHDTYNSSQDATYYATSAPAAPSPAPAPSYYATSAPPPAPVPAPPPPAPAPALASSQYSAQQIAGFFEANKANPPKILAWANQYGLTFDQIVSSLRAVGYNYSDQEIEDWLVWGGIERAPDGTFRMKASAPAPAHAPAPAPAPAPVSTVDSGGGGGGGIYIPPLSNLTDSGASDYSQNSGDDNSTLLIAGALAIGGLLLVSSGKKSRGTYRRRSKKR